MLHFNLISLLVLVGGAIGLAFQLPEIAAGARVYPAILIALVIACSVAIGAKEIAGRATTEPLDGQLARVLSAERPLIMRLLGFVFIWTTYPVTLSHFGFIVSTTAALSLSLWVLQFRKIYVGVLVAALFSLSFSVLFASVLYIPMPQGPLDDLLTQLIYAIQN